MLKLLNNFNNFSFRVLRSLVPNYTGMLRVKAGRPLVNYFLKMVLLVKGSIETSLVKVTVSYIRFLHVLCKRNGIKYVAKYLKASVTLLMQAISGEPHQSTRPLGLAVSRTRRGIPRFIPAIHRSHIRNGNTFYIRLWLSLMSVYRVFDYVGKLNIKTIITPSKAVIDFVELDQALESLNVKRWVNTSLEAGMTLPKPFWISTSSPNSTKAVKDGNVTLLGSGASTSLGSIIKSVWAFANNKPIMRKYLDLSAALGFGGSVLTAISFSRFATRYIPNPMSLTPKIVQEQTYQELYLGKLAFKQEPAGKIRVFAMVDCWTQWLLKPMHQALFNVLRSLKRDATFDQSKTLSDFVQLLKSREIRKVFSFDLTAATDRIPLSAQIHILNSLYNRVGLGDDWAGLLTDRWYSIPFPEWNPAAVSCRYLGIDPSNPGDFVQIKYITWKGRETPFVSAVKYAAGQPMGALSSWAMLALTHHIMVRIAALRAGLSKFDLYLVLGDDLVIADESVATQYLKLAKEWDIEINLSKSVISRNGSLEFAKRFIYKYQDVSGLSFKEMSVAYYDIRGLFQLLNRIKAFRDIRVSEMLSFLGHGYKALSRISARYHQMGNGMRKALLLASYPGMIFSSLTSYEAWLGSTGFNRPMVTNWPSEVLEYLKSLVLSVADTVKQSDLPRNNEEFRAHMHGLYGYVNGKLKFPVNDNHYSFSSLVSTLEMALMPMYYDIIEGWDTTVVEVKDTFEYAEMGDFDIDEYWKALETLEDIASLASNASEFRQVKDVITVGNSSLLKRAGRIRSSLSRFAKEHSKLSNKQLKSVKARNIKSALGIL